MLESIYYYADTWVRNFLNVITTLNDIYIFEIPLLSFLFGVGISAYITAVLTKWIADFVTP